MTTVCITLKKSKIQEVLQEKLDKLKKNKEALSEIELNGKYKKAYDNLLKEIYMDYLKAIYEYIFYYKVSKEFKNKGRKIFLKCLKKRNKEIKEALLEKYSAETVIKILLEIRDCIIDKYFEFLEEGNTINICEYYSLNPWIPEKSILKYENGKHFYVTLEDKD